MNLLIFLIGLTDLVLILAHFACLVVLLVILLSHSFPRSIVVKSTILLMPFLWELHVDLPKWGSRLEKTDHTDVNDTPDSTSLPNICVSVVIMCVSVIDISSGLSVWSNSLMFWSHFFLYIAASYAVEPLYILRVNIPFSYYFVWWNSFCLGQISTAFF